MVINLYEGWYGQSIMGDNQPMLVATHAGVGYENAVWNGKYVIVGDGRLVIQRNNG
jgi:Zn-dependent metalloprotease